MFLNYLKKCIKIVGAYLQNLVNGSVYRSDDVHFQSIEYFLTLNLFLFVCLRVLLLT